jgi:hypothetical protein
VLGSLNRAWENRVGKRESVGVIAEISRPGPPLVEDSENYHSKATKLHGRPPEHPEKFRRQIQTEFLKSLGLEIAGSPGPNEKTYKLKREEV